MIFKTRLQNLNIQKIFSILMIAMIFVMTVGIMPTNANPAMMKAMQRMNMKPAVAEPQPPEGAVVGRFENGLEYVLVPNHSVPLVACNLIVRAGAREETWSTWGAAHLLEHMLFNGTETRTQEQIYDTFDRMGAYDNAHTGNHYTDFMLLVEKDNFLAGFDVLSDMVFNSTLPPEKFEKERGIVMEEIAMTYSRSDDPDQQFNEALFGQTSFGRDILGSVRSIERIVRDSVFAYYKTWYVPNNAFLFVSGDFEPKAMIDSLKSVLTVFEPRNLPPRAEIDIPDFHSLSSPGILKRQANISSSRFNLALQAPLPGSKDFPVFQLLTMVMDRRLERILPDGINGWTNLVNDIDFSVLEVTFTGALGTSPEKYWNDLLADLQQNPPNETELRRLATSYKADRDLTSEQLHYFGIIYSPYWSVINWDEFDSWPRRILEATPVDVNSSFEQWIAHSPSIKMLITPKPEADVETPEEDRDEAKLASVHHSETNNNTYLIREDPTAKVFALHLLFKSRWLWEKEYGVGTVDLLHRMIWEYVDENGMTVSDRLDEIGAKLKTVDSPGIPYDDYYTVPGYSFIRLETTHDKWQAASELLVQLLAEIPIDSSTIINALTSQASVQKSWRRSPMRAAGKQLNAKLLSDTPMSAEIFSDELAEIPVAELQEKLTSLKINYFHPANTVCSVSSSVPEGEFVAFYDGLTEKYFPALAEETHNSETIVKKPVGYTPYSETLKLGQAQGGILMAKMVDRISVEDEAALIVANSWLNEKLSMDIRETKGLAYSLGSSIAEFPDDEMNNWGFWKISVSTRPENNSVALSSVKEILASIPKHKFKEAEVEKLVNAINGRLLMRDMSRIGQAYAMGVGEYFRHDPNRRVALIAQLKEINAKDVQNAARKYMSDEGFSLLIIE